MPTLRPSPARLAVAVAAALVVTSGCAGGAERNSAPTSVTDVSRFRFTIEYHNGGAGGGVVDRRARTGASRIVWPTPWIPGVGVERATARMISTRRAFYRSTTYSLASLRPTPPGAKRWLRSPRDRDLLHAMGIGEAVAPVDAPGTLLTWLNRVADPVAVATGAVRGMPTTQWHARVDLRDVVRVSRGHMREVVTGELYGYLDEGLEPVVVIDVWAGADGVARRARVDEGGTMTLEYFDFGVRTAIRPPPHRRTMTDAELLALVERTCRRGAARRPTATPCASGRLSSAAERVE